MGKIELYRTLHTRDSNCL